MNEQKGNGLTLGRLVYGTSLRRTLFRSVVLALVCLVTFKFMLVPVRVDGGSMAPTYVSNRLNLVNRLAYMRSTPQRGDVVAVRLRETGRSIVYMKRVVGLPGESIGFRNGRVTVDGQQQVEPYVKFESDWDRASVVCGPDEYFVVGDNRSMAIEGHRFGRAKETLILGRMLL